MSIYSEIFHMCAVISYRWSANFFSNQQQNEKKNENARMNKWTNAKKEVSTGDETNRTTKHKKNKTIELNEIK